MRSTAALKLTSKTILIISPESWGISHVSKHHYALELASVGNLVYFLGPPTKRNTIIDVSENLKVLNFRKEVVGVNRLPNMIRKFFVKLEISKIMKLIDSPLDIVWSFDPFRLQDLDLFAPSYRIYHSVDLVTSKWDRYTAAKANLILTSNSSILDRYQNLVKVSHNIGHGLSNYFLDPMYLTINSGFKRSDDRMAVGYSGNLLIQSLDHKTFIEIIETNNKLDFFLFGPYKPSNLSKSSSNASFEFIAKLKALENCYLIGPIPSGQLGFYLNQMDILMICYDIRKYLYQVAYPTHKVLEYLSTGKVIVSNKMLECKSISHLIEMSDENKELPSMISHVAGNLGEFNSQKKVASRISFAKERSYQKKIKEIEKLIQLYN